MDAERRDFLRQNIVRFKDDMIGIEDVMDNLVACRVLSLPSKNEIKARNLTDRERAGALHEFIQKRGPGAFDQYYRALMATENYVLAKILEDHLVDKSLKIIRSDRPASPHAQETGQSVQETFPRSLIAFPADDPTPEVSEDWPDVNDSPLNINVVDCDPSDEDMKRKLSDGDNVYGMKNKNTRIRIKNNEVFENSKDTNEKLGVREGTDIDATSLDLLFRRMGFRNIHAKKDLTGPKVKMEEEYNCKWCPKSYKTKKCALKHMQEAHFTCYFCDFTCGEIVVRMRHLPDCSAAPWSRADGRAKPYSGKRPRVQAPQDPPTPLLDEPHTVAPEMMATTLPEAPVPAVRKSPIPVTPVPAESTQSLCDVQAPAPEVTRMSPTVFDRILKDLREAQSPVSVASTGTSAYKAIPCLSSGSSGDSHTVTCYPRPLAAFVPVKKPDVSTMPKTSTPIVLSPSPRSRPASSVSERPPTLTSSSTQTEMISSYNHVHTIITIRHPDGTRRREEIIQTNCVNECVGCRDRKFEE